DATPPYWLLEKRMVLSLLTRGLWMAWRTQTKIGTLFETLWKGTSNERGERLVEFCRDNGLFITNTAFKHRERRRYTWLSPGGRVGNQIDYILISKR
ncbi:Hypp9716, partial [Branchiostoma lanceolatum]